MAKRDTLFQREIKNIRKALRTRMVILAKGHRGCAQARGCGCCTDQALALLEKSESDLFCIELGSYADTKDKPPPHYLADREELDASELETATSVRGSGTDPKPNGVPAL